MTVHRCTSCTCGRRGHQCITCTTTSASRALQLVHVMHSAQTYAQTLAQTATAGRPPKGRPPGGIGLQVLAIHPSVTRARDQENER